MLVLRALAALLTYPRAELLAALGEIGAAIAASEQLGRADRDRLAGLVAELAGGDPLELEERYVALFERGRARALHLFEHVHGESRDRGEAMVELAQRYERAGLQLAAHELPDFLPVVLEYLSCRPPGEVREMLGDCAHILRSVGESLAARGSRYASVFEALLATAGEHGLDWSVAPEPDPDPDADWAEAPAFGPGSKRDNPTESPLRFMPRGRDQRRGA